VLAEAFGGLGLFVERLHRPRSPVAALDRSRSITKPDMALLPIAAAVQTLQGNSLHARLDGEEHVVRGMAPERWSVRFVG